VSVVDPRPDLVEDADLWERVLAVSKETDPAPGTERSLFGLLHGLRCGGCRLRRTGTSLKLDYEPLLAWWDKEQLLSKWLMPAKEELRLVFTQVAKELAPQGAEKEA